MKRKVCDEEYCDWLRDVLTSNGYNVFKVPHPNYIEYSVTGKGIKGCYCTRHHPEESHWGLNGNFCVFNKNCFTKWTCTPMRVYLPLTKADEKDLLKNLAYIGSKAGERYHRLKPKDQFLPLSNIF